MDVGSTIVGPVWADAWGLIKRHLGYLICYKRKIEDMKTKFDELEADRKDVQQKVEEAYGQRLEEAGSAVEAWLEKVKNADEDVKRIKDESTSAANNKCFLIHFCAHYRLGRQAAHQKINIDHLLAKKGDFNIGVFHSRAAPSSTGSLLVNEKYEMFESRKLYINEILDAFKDETVHMIGVYGMGGIGKTTLVKEAANQAKNDGLFKEVVIVTVSQNLDVMTIQTGIAECLRLELNEQTAQVRADKIKTRLVKEGNKVLVILDDLWNRLDLSKVGITDLDKGTCRVVITTRREDVCNQMQCRKKVALRQLSDEESWLLFKSSAENAVESPTMKKVAWDVAKQCGGLPLALVVLGKALNGKELEDWKKVLKQLKKSTIAVDLLDVNKEVRESIELSYDFLESEAAKWCFLHCCLYPEDYDIDVEGFDGKHLMHMLVGGGLLEDDDSLHEAQERVHLLMGQLKASGLLLEGQYRKSSVRMHDVVRDVGIWIGKRDQYGFFVRAGQGLEEWPRNSSDVKKLQNCQRLSLMSNKIVDLPSNPIKCTKLETLILRNNGRLRNIPEKFFQHMGALKVLDLSHTNISCLPESLSCLTSIKVLNLKGCGQLQDISRINELKMLEILILKHTKRVSVVPEDTGGLLNLRMIDLGEQSTHSLITYFSNVLPVCSRLEQLFIPKYEGCLAQLASLRFLTHLYIWGGAALDSNDSLSQDLGSSRSWTKLQEFLICFGPSPCECYSYPETEKGSRSLHLRRTKHFSPLLKALLEMKIDSLALVDCQESEVIFSKCDIPPHVLSHNLTHLLVSDCPNLTSLGDEPLFPNLKFMTVINCPKLARLLPSKVWQGMHQLEKLEVRDCMTMLQLFPYDQEPMAMTELLPKLAYLKLYKLPQLESVLQPFQCLPNLMELKIWGCGLRCGLAYHEMEMAVADPFPKLEKLEIYGCDEMSQMISSSSSPDAPLQAGMCIVFQNLCDLEVEGCPRLTHLFWSKQAKHMQQLTSLEIVDCDSLTAVVISNENQEQEGASTSTSTSTTACIVVDHHHGSHSFFPLLKELILRRLPEMAAFHQPSTSLPMEWPYLEKHLIEECPKLESPLLGLQQMSQLKLMEIKNFPKMARLLISKLWQGMHQLEELEVADCEAMLQLFPYDDYKPMAMTQLLPNLVILNLSHLPQLESVLQPFQCLPNLMTLKIKECGLRCGLELYHEMEMAAADPFPKLERLEILWCTEMSQMIISSSSPDAPLQGMCIVFQNLTHLYVERCPRLTHLFWSKQAKHMQQLKELQIRDCDSLTAVVISNENQEEGASASTSTSTTACIVGDHHGSHSFFPRLRKLGLYGLPEIAAFHQPSTALPMEWPCLERHFIGECPKLETPLLGSQTSQRSTVVESLDEVRFEKDDACSIC